MHNRLENTGISSVLTGWYNKNKRDLPWRHTQNPYLIWISEIILQQTRVNQGYDYFNRFIKRFPTIASLAQAEEDEVLKLWQGLGYYSRARNLHTTAKTIMKNFDGVFPTHYKDILSLKGIGEYTAAAIASFSYNEPYAVLDGNVFRVLSRIFGINIAIDTPKGKKAFTEIANQLLDKNNPGIYNQAIMEFGALQCVPVNPACNICPLQNKCLAYASGQVNELPVKSGKVNIKNRYFNYFDIRYQEYTYLHKRINKDIWKNLYEYPLIETSESITLEELIKKEEFTNLFGEKNIRIRLAGQAKHILSHRIIYANFYQVNIEEELPENCNFIKINQNNLEDYAVSRLVHKYIEKINR